MKAISRAPPPHTLCPEKVHSAVYNNSQQLSADYIAAITARQLSSSEKLSSHNILSTPCFEHRCSSSFFTTPFISCFLVSNFSAFPVLAQYLTLSHTVSYSHPTFLKPQSVTCRPPLPFSLLYLIPRFLIFSEFLRAFQQVAHKSRRRIRVAYAHSNP